MRIHKAETLISYCLSRDEYLMYEAHQDSFKKIVMFSIL